MYSTPTVTVNINQDFEFLSTIGADNSMLDYAKMVILFSFQKEFDTVYKNEKY